MDIGVIGIILSLVLLIYLAYRGITVLILAPVMAMLAVIISGQPVMASYTEVFMPAMAGYLKSFFPLFLLGAIFGKIMDDSGAARSIALFITDRLGSDRAILAVVLSCAILTYGGVSLFVVAFAVYPIAAALFRASDIPKRLIPAALALGSFTFTMTALPGTPQIQNAIPMPYFGTTTFAAPILGLVGAVIMFGGGMAWLNYRSRRAQAAGEGYGEHTRNENLRPVDIASLPNVGFALLPILIVIGLNYLLVTYYYTEQLDTAYLADYNVALGQVKGIWAIIIALVVGIVAAIALFWTKLKERMETLNQGSYGSMLAILNTASEVGYGNTIRSLQAFAAVQTALLSIPGTPLLSIAVATSVLAGITGSASGGLSIALGALGDTYAQIAAETGISPEAFHRIAVMACGGLDSLPHNGAVITLLNICGLTHRESYMDIGICTVLIPLLATGVAIVLATFGIV